ncbi:MAG: 30S ribosomal protein S16 [Candidatus Calescibacterium sp.]|nr:30S ribosomal protein S16 [Candidatus Calescibacterium sp.]MCX7734747.1 30S ribosomal protein S16 [bacterium]MDW8087271.1 30S ribosomal protein S16 [Candidatus Calescibacterium sp.]
MVRIRLQRFGRKKDPFYRIVVADSRSPRDGKFIEIIGYYEPKKKILKIERDKYLQWLKNGAQPTDIVVSLVKNFKVIDSKPSEIS